MAVEPGTVSATVAAPRTGPVGRIVRLLLAVAGVWFTYHVWDRRGFILVHGDLFLTGLMVYGTHQLAALYRRGKEALAALAGLGAVAGAVALMQTNQLWAPPLSWLVWGLDLGFLAMVTVGLFVAVPLGTPGCEVAAIPEVIARLRGRTHQSGPVFCLVGLHKLDAWEAHRSWRRGAVPPAPPQC